MRNVLALKVVSNNLVPFWGTCGEKAGNQPDMKRRVRPCFEKEKKGAECRESSGVAQSRSSYVRTSVP